ncbi:hypothetical protein AAHE18_14G077900 [Arachis hypogaea]
MASTCPSSPSIECRKCKQKGHISYNCPTLLCHYCKLLGHLITTCPIHLQCSYQNKYQSSSNYTNQNVPASTTAAATESINSASLNPHSISPSNIVSFLKVLLSFSSNTSTILSTSPGNSKWYFDSGYFNHMSPLHLPFSSLSTTTNAPSINIVDGSLLHVTHKGFISHSNLNLPNTYFISKLNFNLLSVGQLAELGFEINFSISGCRVQDRWIGHIIEIGRKGRKVV